jgi:hypothetical protein
MSTEDPGEQAPGTKADDQSLARPAPPLEQPEPPVLSAPPTPAPPVRAAPPARRVRRVRRPTPTGCVLTVLMIWIGLGATLVDYRLVLAARVYCGAGDGPGDVVALNLEMLPRLLIGPLMAFGPYALIIFAGRTGPLLWRFLVTRTFVRLVAIAAGLAAVGGMIVFDFAHIGTLAGLPGDSGLCGPDNVPPWWPAWLPS